MRKLFLSIIALTLGIGAWAQETQSVNYIDADGQQKTVTATVVTDETGTLSAGWYVVTGEVSRGSITCDGDVHLILADWAKLTATGGEEQAGITVSGDGNSLTIYGQAAQLGQLIATGGKYAAGIGGGYEGSGSNITINGGTVTASSGSLGAGIGGGFNGSGSYITINGGSVCATGESDAAGIGGGWLGSGSYITINGGVVTANGECGGIGGGGKSSGSYIFIATNYIVKADNNNPPTTVILNDGTDLADKLAGKHYVTVESDPLFDVKAAAIELIQTARQGIQNDEINTIIDNGVDAIRTATTEQQVEDIKREMMTVITYIQIGKAEALGPLGEEHPGPAVKVTKGGKEVILYLPDKVEYIIRK